MRPVARALSIAWLLALAGLASAQDALPGLILEFVKLADDDADTAIVLDARTSRMAALAVAGGESPSRFVAPGAFTARFRGWLELPLRTPLEFSARGRGSVTLVIAEVPLLTGTLALDQSLSSPSRRIAKGRNYFELTLTSDAAGAAELRLFWRGRDFEFEPVPASAFLHDPADAQLARATQLRRGLALMERAQCANCHRWPGAAAADAPGLAAITKRLHPDWIAHWLIDPRAVRADSSMPSLLDLDPSIAMSEAVDLIAYLKSLADESAPSSTASPGSASDVVIAGRAVFDRLGCAACHTLSTIAPAATDISNTRIALDHVRAKFQSAALDDYLREPARHRPQTWMPDFRLTQGDAEALAACMLQHSRDEPGAPPAGGDAERGRALSGKLGCFACHSRPEGDAPATTRAFASMAQIAAKSWGATGCVGGGGGVSAPRFGFAPDEIEALEALRAHGLDALSRSAPAEDAPRMIATARCLACHARDGQSDLWTRLGAATPIAPVEESATTLLQIRPDLTHTGDKLRPAWMRRLFAGEVDPPVRPWLEARMPAFAAHAEQLSIALAREHGHLTSTADLRTSESPVAQSTESRTGESLLSTTGGFACDMCHAYAGKQPIAAFEMGAINLDLARHRLRADYFERWMRDPRRIDPLTRMPSYVDATGKTALSSVADGDAKTQFTAIWRYLLTRP